MPLSSAARSALLQIARDAATRAVRDENYIPPNPNLPELEVAGGCFVTLKTDGRLRGCLGCFTAPGPLYKTVAQYAALAATEDSRFAHDRLKPVDMERVELDVSVLSPLAPCADPLAIRLGIDGIYVRSGGRSGCFLPQVAMETGWGVAEFWERCTVDKAGLASGSWRGPGVERFTFTAEVIHDSHPAVS